MPYLGTQPPSIPISGTDIEAGTISTANIADAAVATAKIADVNVTTAKIANDAITLAKLAAGTDGELITWDAAGNPAAVAVGTATHVLTSNGTGAAPTFQEASGGAIVLVSSTTTSSTPTSIDFTTLSTDYSHFMIECSNITRATGTDSYGIGLQVGTGGSPTYQTSNYFGSAGFSYNAVSPATDSWASADTASQFAPLVKAYATGAGSCRVTIYGVHEAKNNYIHSEGSFWNGGSNYHNYFSGGLWKDTTVVTALRVMVDTGTINNGAIVSLYGIKTS